MVLTRLGIAELTDAKTFQSAAGADGNGTAWTSDGWASFLFQVTGTFSATVNFELTLNGSDYVAVQAVNLNNGTVATTATAAGLYLVSIAGGESVRARVSSWASGTVTVVGRGSPFDGSGAPADIDVAGAESVTQGTTPWIVSDQAETPANGAQVTCDDTAGGVALKAANANRKGLLLSHVSGGAVIVGDNTVTATTGYFRMAPGDSWVFLPVSVIGTGLIHGIREGGTSGVVLVSEVT